MRRQEKKNNGKVVGWIEQVSEEQYPQAGLGS